MEIIFSRSRVLESFLVDTPYKLCPEYISKNPELISDIIEGPNIWTKLLLDKYDQININELMSAIKLLHKYGVDEYYHKIINVLRKMLFMLDYSQKNREILSLPEMCTDIMEDIIMDSEKSGIIYWLMGYPISLTINDFIFNEELLDYGLSRRYEGILNINILAKYGTPKIIEKFNRTKYWEIIKYTVCEKIAIHGNLELMKWCREKKFAWGYSAQQSAKHGHFEMLKWIKESGCKFDERVCSEAAKGGQLDILVWLRENNCPWDKFTTRNIAERGDFITLIWAINNKCEYDYVTWMKTAKAGNLEILKWANQKKIRLDPIIFDHPIVKKQNKIIKWAKSKGLISN